MALTIAAIVCAYNEAATLPACLHSLHAQTRPPDQIVVINNASTDATRAVAREMPGVQVVDEPVKGLVAARERARLSATTEILAYTDADCRAPLRWLEQVERRFVRQPATVAVTGPCRYYDWDLAARALIRKSWPHIARTPRANVDVALTLYRNGSWAA